MHVRVVDDGIGGFGGDDVAEQDGFAGWGAGVDGVSAGGGGDGGGGVGGREVVGGEDAEAEGGAVGEAVLELGGD